MPSNDNGDQRAPYALSGAVQAGCDWRKSAMSSGSDSSASEASTLRLPTGAYRVKRRRRAGPVPCWNVSPNSSRPYTVTRPEGETSHVSPSTVKVRRAITVDGETWEV